MEIRTKQIRTKCSLFLSGMKTVCFEDAPFLSKVWGSCSYTTVELWHRRSDFVPVGEAKL